MWLFDLIRKFLKSKVVQFFVITHLIIVIAIFLFKPGQDGGSLGYKFFDEPLYYRIMFYLELPTILVAGLIFYPMQSLKFYNLEIYIYCFIFLGIGSIQWGFVGYCFENILGFFARKRLQ